MKIYLYCSISYWNRIVSIPMFVYREGMSCIENMLVSSIKFSIICCISYTLCNSRIPWYESYIFVQYLHASSIHLWAKCPPSQVKQLKHLSSARSPNPPLICTGQRSHASWWRAQLACWAVRSCSCFPSTNWEAGRPLERHLGHFCYGVMSLVSLVQCRKQQCNFCLTRRCVAFAKAGHKLREFCPVIWYKKMPFGKSCSGSSPRLGWCGMGFNRKVGCFEANTSRVKRVHLAVKMGLGPLCLAFQLCKVFGGGAPHCSGMAARSAATVSGTSTEAECWCCRLLRFGRDWLMNPRWLST